MDEIFGRENFCNQIAVKTNSAFGYKGTSDSLFKQAGFILFYAKQKTAFKMNKVFLEKDYDTAYKFVFDDLSIPESQWTWRGIKEATAKKLGFISIPKATDELGKEQFEAEIAKFALENSERVFRTASVTGGAYLKRKKTIEKSKKNKSTIIRHPNDDMDYMFIGGERVLFYKERLVSIDGIDVPGEIVTDIWDDIPIEGIANEGGVSFPKGKKPEKLIYRIIDLATSDNEDYVLDFFAGSGTMAAVAHKMNRRWIAIEQMDYIQELPETRLKSVIAGEQSGVSKSVNWQGGGSFIYCELAQANQAFVEKIQGAKTSKALQQIWDDMQDKGFLSYRIDPKAIDTESPDFTALSLDDQKRFLIEVLDKNMLYVPLSEMDDKTYNISAEDKKLNRLFFNRQ